MDPITIVKRQQHLRDGYTPNRVMDEVLPQYSAIEDAYSSVLMKKIMSASGKQRRGGSFDQSAYSKAVFSFYGAERRTSSGDREKYCYLTGWQDAKLVKCAHIESIDYTRLFDSCHSEP